MKAELQMVRPPVGATSVPPTHDVEDPLTSSHERQLASSRERELGAIVADMWENGEKLVRQELELGLAEIDIRVDKLKQSLLMGAIGGFSIYAGLLVLLASVVLGLSKVMEPWLAALIVGAVVTGAGVAFALRGEKKAEEAVKPDEHLHRTTRAMKEAIK